MEYAIIMQVVMPCVKFTHVTWHMCHFGTYIYLQRKHLTGNEACVFMIKKIKIGRDMNNFFMAFLIKILVQALTIALGDLHICQAKSEGTCPLDTQFAGLLEDRYNDRPNH